jgi:NitT/TauT family transport system substrate-binding protein
VPKPAATNPPAAAAKPTEAPKPAATAAPKPATPSFVLKEKVSASHINNWFAQPSQAGYYAAAKNNRYADLNLDLRVDQGGPGISAVPLVASGKQTFGMSSGDALLSARQEGIPLVAIFTTFQTFPQGLMYRASMPINDFPDLQGKHVYVSPPGTYWQFIQKKYKLDVQQFNYNGQLSNFLGDEGAVTQCYVSSEPLTAKQQGIDVKTLLIANGGYNPYANLMMTTEQMIREKPEVVQAYVAGSLQGWLDYLANPAPIHEYIKQVNPEQVLELMPDVAAIERPFILGPTNDLKAVGTMTEGRWKAVHDAMVDVGVLNAPIDYRAAFDTHFIDNALKAMS